MFQSFEIPNYLSDAQLLFIEHKKQEAKTYISNTGKKLNLFQIDLPENWFSDFGTVIKSEVYELQEPYRIHNDARNEVTSKYTCIVPLDDNPQGGVTVFNQWATHFTYSLDPYYSSSYNKQLPLEERHIINEWNPAVKLPDNIEFEHIRDSDKIGFTIAQQFEFEFNKLVVFPSINFHCSNYVSGFTSKSSLVAFTM